FPDGIDASGPGPFSRPTPDFSVFNDGLEVELVKEVLGEVLVLRNPPTGDCTRVPGLANGIQIFPGSVPLYRGRRLIGAVGVSGDGVDQDDIVAAAGSAGFEAPPTCVAIACAAAACGGPSASSRPRPRRPGQPRP